MIIDKRGYLYSFGLPEYGQLGHNTDGKFFVSSNKLTYQFETSPRRVPVFVERSKDGHPTPVTDVKIVDIACGNNHSVSFNIYLYSALFSSAVLYWWVRDLNAL